MGEDRLLLASLESRDRLKVVLCDDLCNYKFNDNESVSPQSFKLKTKIYQGSSISTVYATDSVAVFAIQSASTIHDLIPKLGDVPAVALIKVDI